jgi:two-component system, NarL family, response regulator DegU
MNKISIALVDDHKIFRDGLKLNLKEYSDQIEIIGEVEDGKELMQLLQDKTCDIVMFDYQLRDTSGIQIAVELRSYSAFDGIKMIMLTAHKSNTIFAPNYELIIEAIDCGFDAYLLKDSSIEEIVECINKVQDGDHFFLGETIDIKEINKILIKDRKHLNVLLRKYRNFGLSDREIEIIKSLSQGLSAKEIGVKLHISEDAVNSHKDNIKNKLHEKHDLNLRNNVELVVWAIKNKIILI